MNTNFWKKLLSFSGFVFFLSVIAIVTLIVVRSESGNPLQGGILGAILGTIILALIPTVIISIPYAFYLFGKYSRLSDPHSVPENHVAFQNPENAPVASPTAAVSVEALSNKRTIIGIDGMIEKSWTFYQANFKKMWPIFLVGSFGTILATLFYSGIFNAISLLGLKYPYLTALVIVAIIIISVLALLAKIALYTSISDGHKGQYVGFVDSFKKASKFFWQFLVLVLMMWFAWNGAALLFLVPGIILYGYLLFSQLVFIDSGKKGFDAMLGSWTIVKKHWWGNVLKLFVVSLLFGLIAFAGEIIFIIIGVILAVITIAIHMPVPIIIALGILLALVFILSLVTVIQPLILISFFELYYSLAQARVVELAEDVSISSRRKTKLIIVIVLAVVLFIPETYFGYKWGQEISQWQTTLVKNQELSSNYSQDLFMSTSTSINTSGSTSTSSSSQPNFTIDFPSQPTYTTQTLTAPGSNIPYMINEYSDNESASVSYQVGDTQFSSAIPLSNNAIQDSLNGELKSDNGVLSTSSLEQFGEYPAITYQFYSKDYDVNVQGENIVVGNQLYQIFVLYRGIAPKNINQFISSFHLK